MVLYSFRHPLRVLSSVARELSYLTNFTIKIILRKGALAGSAVIRGHQPVDLRVSGSIPSPKGAHARGDQLMSLPVYSL